MSRPLLAVLALSVITNCSTPAHPDSGRGLWVDRLEGSYAVVVDDGVPPGGPGRAVPLASLPEGVRGGERLVGGRPDPGATAALRADIEALIARLARRRPLTSGRKRRYTPRHGAP